MTHIHILSFDYTFQGWVPCVLFFKGPMLVLFVKVQVNSAKLSLGAANICAGQDKLISVHVPCCPYKNVQTESNQPCFFSLLTFYHLG